jgi:type VII secretion protein EccB
VATKKDLIEAQGFSRRRLLSAFTGGAPGGKELEPAKPLRAVAAGIALTAMLILGGVFYGLVRPGLPTGWQNDRLILASDTGARYVSVKGVLYPVINTASARLLIPAGKFSVITTDQKTLAGIKIGSAVGILGAPDDLPALGSLVGTGWAACESPAATTSLVISPTPSISATAAAAVVSLGGSTYVVVGNRRYAVSHANADAVLRAVGLGTAATAPVDGRWLNLFEPGAALAPITVAGAGAGVSGSDLKVGSVVHPTGAADDQRYLVTANGQLARLSPLAYQLYLLGTGARLGAERQVSPAAIASLPTAKAPGGGSNWPTSTLTALSGAAPACALLRHTGATATTVLATAASDASFPSGAGVHAAAGAIVRTGAKKSGETYLVDKTGTAFAVPGATAEIVGRLGYTESDVTEVSQGWIDFLPSGPPLTVAAAGSSPKAASALSSDNK